MKKLILIAGLMIPLAAMGQRSIDRLFDRYAGRDGFTTITLTGDLLKLAANFGDEDDRDINARITGIRILTEDDETRGTVNFLDIISRDLDDKDYEEFMSGPGSLLKDVEHGKKARHIHQHRCPGCDNDKELLH